MLCGVPRDPLTVVRGWSALDVGEKFGASVGTARARPADERECVNHVDNDGDDRALSWIFDSLGADGQLGGETINADIVSWKAEETGRGPGRGSVPLSYGCPLSSTPH